MGRVMQPRNFRELLSFRNPAEAHKLASFRNYGFRRRRGATTPGQNWPSFRNYASVPRAGSGPGLASVPKLRFRCTQRRDPQAGRAQPYRRPAALAIARCGPRCGPRGFLVGAWAPSPTAPSRRGVGMPRAAVKLPSANRRRWGFSQLDAHVARQGLRLAERPAPPRRAAPWAAVQPARHLRWPQRLRQWTQRAEFSSRGPAHRRRRTTRMSTSAARLGGTTLTRVPPENHAGVHGHAAVRAA